MKYYLRYELLGVEAKMLWLTMKLIDHNQNKPIDDLLRELEAEMEEKRNSLMALEGDEFTQEYNKCSDILNQIYFIKRFYYNETGREIGGGCDKLQKRREDDKKAA
jgi:hypothetical protein